MGGELDKVPVDTRIQRVADRQHGMVHVTQAAAQGLGHHAIAHRVATGRWHRQGRGVYSIGPPAAGRLPAWMAATLGGGPGTVLADASAGALLGLLRGDGGVTIVAVPGSGGRARRDGVRVRRLRLEPFEVTTVNAIPTTTCARTLLDLAVGASPHRVARLVTRAEQLRLYDHRLVLASLVAHPNHPGRRVLVAALDAFDEPFAGNGWLEHAMHAICERAGVAVPLSGEIVAGHECDFFWPDHGLIVETDGWETHGTRRSFRSDRARDAEHTALGYRVVRLTYDRIAYDPQGVAELLRRLLRPRRGASGLPQGTAAS